MVQVVTSQTLTGGGAGITSDFVKVRGAKAVHFIVYSTTAGETDAFVAPDLKVKVNNNAGAVATITDPTAQANAYGVLAPNANACVTAGNVGYVLSVYPDQPGTEAGSPIGQRFAIDELAILINPHATNDISTCVAWAFIEY